MGLRGSFRRHLLGITTAALLGGCTTLGPDFEEPQVSWLDDWQTDFYGQITASAETATDLQQWWTRFNDPVLDELIAMAGEGNPGIQIAGLRILESRARLGIAVGSRYPQVQQIAGNVNYLNTQQHGGSANTGDQSLTAYQAAFNLGWELDFWGRFQRGIESADAAFFSDISRFHDTQVLLHAQVVDLYFAYRTARQRIAIARFNVDLQEHSLTITRELFESGQSSELDLQQAKTQYLTTLSSIPALEIALTQIENGLSALLGRRPGDLMLLKDLSETLPLLQSTELDVVPAEILMRRPDIRAAAWQVAAQSAQIGLAEADLYPGISLVGTLGWSGNDLSSTGDTGTFSAGSVLNWNIFNYGRIRNNVRVQDARLQQAIENYENTVLQAAREIDSAAIGVVKNREQNVILKASVEAAERSLAIANSRYKEGYADFQRVLDAQRALAAQMDRELVNQGNQFSATVDFYRSLGAGWQPAPIDSIVQQQTRDEMDARSNWGELLTAPLPQRPESLPATAVNAPPE